MADANDAISPLDAGSHARDGALAWLPALLDAPSRPLVATAARWASGSAAFGLGLTGAAEGILLFTHSSRALTSFGAPLALGAVVGAVVLFFVLRSEEARLARELRTARTGTPTLRGLVARRRVALPLLTRFASTQIGTAAVLAADGDRDGALDALGKTAALMRSGRLETLRGIVEADLQRGAGTSASVERCLAALRDARPVGNREADLYRIHVLTKAILAKGDAETGFALASQLSSSGDDDARVYATWLRVWFDLDVDEGEGGKGEQGGQIEREGQAGQNGDDDDWPELTDGDLRMATLIARAQGADSLVSKLASRLSAIARPDSQE